ncbi:MAG TPA: hypothetical protein VMZ22_10200 [Acidimicrobiales bacterium]|nr:hypothetical protein [Acidimicrobiales bacterium]
MRRRLFSSAALCVAIAVFSALAPAHRANAWTSLAAAPIHPGVQTITGGSQCTANFVFTNGTDVLLGQAAHCAGTGPPTDTNGCVASALPLGTPVQISGASRAGVLVYSSWSAMQATRENNSDLCRFNDFALVRIDPADHRLVNPSVPRWGGPTGLAVAAPRPLAKVYSYGNSSLRLGLTKLAPKIGLSLGSGGDGRTHLVYSGTPGIPGDSGAGLLNQSGSAVGVLSTVGLTPFPLGNYYTDLYRALEYARGHGLPGVQLVRGTKAFNGAAFRLFLG